MSSSLRHESLQYARQEAPLIPPTPEEYAHLHAGSPEALEYLTNLKPKRFVSLAQGMDAIFEDMFAAGWTDTAATSHINEPWLQLHMAGIESFNKSQRAVTNSPAYQSADGFNKIRLQVGGYNYVELSTLMLTGVKTASENMLTLLRNLPELTSQLAPQHNYDIESVARNSIGLPWRVAMASVEQMLGAQSALSSEPSHRLWRTVDAQLDPTKFQLTAHEDGTASVRYENFGQLALPIGHVVIHGATPLTETTALKDLPSSNGPIIGCPITLLSGRLQQMWNGYIDHIVENQMWSDKQLRAAA